MCLHRSDEECFNSALSLHRNSGVIPRSARWRSSVDSRAFWWCLAAACVDRGHGRRGGFGEWLTRRLVSDVAQRRRNLLPQSIPRDRLQPDGDVTGEDVDFVVSFNRHRAAADDRHLPSALIEGGERVVPPHDLQFELCPAGAREESAGGPVIDVKSVASAKRLVTLIRSLAASGRDVGIFQIPPVEAAAQVVDPVRGGPGVDGGQSGLDVRGGFRCDEVDQRTCPRAPTRTPSGSPLPTSPRYLGASSRAMRPERKPRTPTPPAVPTASHPP